MFEKSWWEFFFFTCGIYRLLVDLFMYRGMLIRLLTSPSLLLEFLSSFFFHTHRSNYSDKSGYHKLDIIDLRGGKNGKVAPAPSSTTILVFVHGGWWGSGRLSHYFIPTKRFGEVIGASYAVVLGYPVYPTGAVEQQAEAIIEGLDYLQKESILKTFFNEKRDTSRIILAGHSTGANISLLALIKLLLSKKTIPINAYFGLSGLYDLVSLHPYLAEQKKLHLNPMIPATGHRHEGMVDSSPALILSKNEDLIRDVRFPYIGLMQGLTDPIVPFSQTTRLNEQLSPILKGKIKCILLKDYGHIDTIVHLYSPGNDATKLAISEIFADYLEKENIAFK